MSSVGSEPYTVFHNSELTGAVVVLENTLLLIPYFQDSVRITNTYPVPR